MSYKIIILLFFFSISRSLTMQAQTLNVEISKVRSTKGNILLSVYNAEKGFPYESTSCIKIFTLKPQVGNVLLSTKDLSRGTYAIALFHDADGNGKLSTNILGMPRRDMLFQMMLPISWDCQVLNPHHSTFRGIQRFTST